MTSHTATPANAAEREFLQLLALVKPSDFPEVLKALARVAQHQGTATA